MGMNDDAGMLSAAYEGTITHARYGKIEHNFTYRIFMMYIDMSELSNLNKLHPLWSFSGKINWFFFRRKDYLDQKNKNIVESIKELLIKKGFTGSADNVKNVRMLTHIRYLGYCYNPVTFYLTYSDKKNSQPDFIVVDINNTPWNERYPYVFEVKKSTEYPFKFNLKKEFHVSPFYPMNMEYNWKFDFKPDIIQIDMNSYIDQKLCFNAKLRLQRLDLSRNTMTKILFRYPCMTAKTMFAIYWQALHLFMKRVKFYVHPQKKPRIG